MKLVVRITRRTDSYETWCPALPGCRVSAVSKKEVCKRIQVAIHGYLASMDVALPTELGGMLEMDPACVTV